MKNKKTITDSQFYMWRTLFAIAHVDNTVSDEEVRFMAEALEDVPFSEEQRAVLTDDIRHPKKIAEMFAGVTDMLDQARFFKFAHGLVWADGNFGKDEQKIMLELGKAHVKVVDMDKLVGKIDLEFEDGFQPPAHKTKIKTTKDIVFHFRDAFFKN